MPAVSYYLSLPFLYLLAILPFPLLYILSDAVYIAIYYVIGYRRNVVRDNLKKSFPSKTEAEIKSITKSFYRYLCDLFLETFKTLTISPAKMLKHCALEPESQLLFDKLAAENINFMIVMGHLGNWEWAGNTFSLTCKHQLYVIYHPLANKYFNSLVIKMRTRFGTKLIAMRDTFREMVQNRNELNVTAFIADQTPSPDKAYWMNFLNQDTPVFMGTEKIAQKMNYPIVYVQVQKIRRGYYSLKAEVLKSPPFGNSEGEITEAHTKRLEKDIICHPDTWLWTHRRWKHTRAQ